MIYVNEVLENAARYWAKKAGWKAVKQSRGRSRGGPGGFRIIDPSRDRVMYGQGYEMTAQQVIDLCRQLGAQPR